MKFTKFAKKWLTPFGLLLLGLLVLMFIGNIYVAGVCFSLGIVMIINWFLPEKREKCN